MAYLVTLDLGVIELSVNGGMNGEASLKEMAGDAWRQALGDFIRRA